MTYYTYMWLRYDGTPYYIGKGKKYRGFCTGWHRVTCPKDRERIIAEYHVSEEEAYEAEKFFIAFYGREDLGTGILLNRTDGGEGAATTAGKKLSPEHVEKIRRALTGKKRPYMSIRNKSLKMRMACSAYHKGKVLSPETRAKISLARKRRFGQISEAQIA